MQPGLAGILPAFEREVVREMKTTVPFHVYRRTIERAAQTLGGEARLARYLDVPLDKLRAWRTVGGFR